MKADVVLMKGIFADAREKLGALPKWLKVAMWAQVMTVGIFGFGGLGGMLAIQTDQIAVIANVMNKLPQTSEAHAQLVHVIEIGVHDGRGWILQLVVGLTASVIIGFMIVFITPWRSHSRDKSTQPCFKKELNRGK
jgi:hypothetical protein